MQAELAAGASHFHTGAACSTRRHSCVGLWNTERPSHLHYASPRSARFVAMADEVMLPAAGEAEEQPKVTNGVEHEAGEEVDLLEETGSDAGGSREERVVVSASYTDRNVGMVGEGGMPAHAACSLFGPTALQIWPNPTNLRRVALRLGLPRLRQPACSPFPQQRRVLLVPYGRAAGPAPSVAPVRLLLAWQPPAPARSRLAARRPSTAEPWPPG